MTSLSPVLSSEDTQITLTAATAIFNLPLRRQLKRKTKHKKDISKQLSKEAISQGKLREITKCLQTRFS